jgi:flagellar biosynthetic protein FlhB
MICMGKFPWRCKPSNDDRPRAGFVFCLQRFADGDKTEEPTSKKRSDARKKGQVARSQELNTAFVLLIGFAVLKVLWERLYTELADYTVYIFDHLNQTMDIETVLNLFIGMVEVLLKTAFPCHAVHPVHRPVCEFFPGGDSVQYRAAFLQAG